VALDALIVPRRVNGNPEVSAASGIVYPQGWRDRMLAVRSLLPRYIPVLRQLQPSCWWHSLLKFWR